MENHYGQLRSVSRQGNHRRVWGSVLERYVSLSDGDQHDGRRSSKWILENVWALLVWVVGRSLCVLVVLSSVVHAGTMDWQRFEGQRLAPCLCDF